MAKDALVVEFADNAADIRASQALRYQVFAEEMGAEVTGANEGLDIDEFDAHCKHIVVRETATNKIVGCTRILPQEAAEKMGEFYSAKEFDLSAVTSKPGRFLEMGRTCIAPEFRSGATIALIWSKLADYKHEEPFDYLIGCASIPWEDGGAVTHRILEMLNEKHLSPPDWRVIPKTPVPPAEHDLTQIAKMTPLIKAYNRAGAVACGEACWDPEFQVADVFMLLDMEKLESRYLKHFVERAASRTAR